MEESDVRSRMYDVAWSSPSARAFDRKSDVIEALDDVVTVDAFNISEKRLEVRLQATRELSVTTYGLRIWSLAPSPLDVDCAVFEHVTDTVAEVLAARVGSTRALFQHLVPWLDAADGLATTQRATSRILGDLAQEHRFKDFALLVDGERITGGSYKAEFGVVTSSQEATVRLARLIGQFSEDPESRRSVPRSLDLLIRQDLPEISTFVDSWWDIVAEREQNVRDAVTEAQSEADRLVVRLHRFLTGAGD